MITNYVIYDYETSEAAKRFTDHLAKAMGEAPGLIRQVIKDVSQMVVWYTPSIIPKRRGVRARAKALKWRRK
jgi:hypothetical protein